MKKLTAIVLGCGGRGLGYTKQMYRFPEKFEVVGAADVNENRLELMREAAGLSKEQCYSDWREVLAKPKMADFAIIATQDNDHYEPAMRAIELGYNLLLEKPAAQTPQECVDIANAARRKGVSVLVCHVLRYTDFYKRIKTLVKDDVIGEIQSVIAVEAVGHLHQSHSFVRGDWGDTKISTPMIVAKCCHDMDILQWIIDKPCKKVSSFGELTHFRPENAPKGAPIRCKDGHCPAADTCPYNCEKIYGSVSNDWFRYIPARAISSDPTDEDVAKALRETNFGLCVYHAGNDAVDHQVVNMEFEGGVTVSFSMNAFNSGGRFIRLFGTKGELTANMSDTEIDVYSFADRSHHIYKVKETDEAITGGHGGGDTGIILDLYDYFTGNYNGFSVAEIHTSVANHMIAFAAEEARLTDSVVSIDAFDERYGFENDYTD